MSLACMKSGSRFGGQDESHLSENWFTFRRASASSDSFTVHLAFFADSAPERRAGIVVCGKNEEMAEL